MWLGPPATMSVNGRVAQLGGIARRDSRRALAMVLARTSVANVPRRAPVAFNAIAIGDMVRRLVRYVGEPAETFSDLPALVYLGAGDCDEIAAACAALLLASGHDVYLVVGWRDGRPEHIWALAAYDGVVVDVDASHPSISPGESPAPLFDGMTLHDLDGRRLQALGRGP